MTEQLAIDFTAPTGRDLRDDGIARAVEHADADVSEWSTLALEAIGRFAATHVTLTAEEVRVAAYTGGLPRPVNERAWGGPFAKARKAGIIAPGTMETATDPKVHCSYMMRWRSLTHA